MTDDRCHLMLSGTDEKAWELGGRDGSTVL